MWKATVPLTRGWGWFQDGSGALPLLCTLFLLLYIRPISDHQASDRFQRLGNLALTLAFSGTWVFCLFVFFPITLGWQEVTTGFKSGCGGSASRPMLTLSWFFLHVHAQLPWISRSGHQNTHAENKKNPAQGSQSPSCGPLPASSLQHSIVKAGRNSITSPAKLGTHLTSLD